jgi:hypothetical protein
MSHFEPNDPPCSVETTLTERGERYGKYVNVAKTSQLLKGIVAQGLIQSGNELDYDMRESLDLICNKISRIVNGDPSYHDSWHDIGGYAKLVADRLQGVER